MTREEEINMLIKSGDTDTNKISDGYHTFAELYEHRIVLFMAICRILEYDPSFRDLVWKSKLHSDGTSWEGWFIMGIRTEPGKQISYHLPMSKWAETDYIHEIERAPEFDGHTSSDVLNRINKL